VEQIETAFLEVVDGNGNIGATFPGTIKFASAREGWECGFKQEKIWYLCLGNRGS
jgi:hypothetical protein